jgi:hypothetical protein
VEVLVYTWSVFLTLGGGICLGSKIRGTWIGEIIGLPLLSAANYILGVLLLFRGSTSAAVAIGVIFCGMGTTLLSRWVELRKLAKDNQGVNSER